MVRLFTIVHQSGCLPFSSEMLHTYSGVDGMLPPFAYRNQRLLFRIRKSRNYPKKSRPLILTKHSSISHIPTWKNRSRYLNILSQNYMKNETIVTR